MYSWSGKVELMEGGFLMTEEQVRAIVREEIHGERRRDPVDVTITHRAKIKDLDVSGTNVAATPPSEKQPRMSIAMNYDDEGRPLFEVDGRVVGPADGVLLMLLDWKRKWGGKAVWDQIDAFKKAFVQI